jgi:hypothetical protein
LEQLKKIVGKCFKLKKLVKLETKVGEIVNPETKVGENDRSPPYFELQK